MSNYKYELFFIGFFVICLSVIVSAIICFKYLTCAAQWEESGRDFKFGILSGCLVKDGAVWVPDTSIRNID